MPNSIEVPEMIVDHLLNPNKKWYKKLPEKVADKYKEENALLSVAKNAFVAAGGFSNGQMAANFFGYQRAGSYLGMMAVGARMVGNVSLACGLYAHFSNGIFSSLPPLISGMADLYRDEARERNKALGLNRFTDLSSSSSYQRYIIERALSSNKNFAGAYAEACRNLGSPSNFNYDSFRSLVRSTGLVDSYNSLNPDDHIPPLGSRSDIGGVAVKTGLITDLRSSSDILLLNEHAFGIRTLDGKMPFSNQELRQVLHELAVGIYVHNTLPFFSLHFNNDGMLYPVIHPAYQNTLVGRVIGYLDIQMKGFLNGGFYPEEFLASWHQTQNTNRDYLKSHLIDIKKLCKKLEIPLAYHSLREMAYRAGIGDPKHEQFQTSFRIIAQQKSIRRHQGIFLINPDFDVEHTIERLADYHPTSTDHHQEYLKREILYSQYQQEIAEKMPKLPFSRDYFEMLHVISFFSYYFSTLKDMGKVPEFDYAASESVPFPTALPPYPVREYHFVPFKITIRHILEKVDRKILDSYLQDVYDKKQFLPTVPLKQQINKLFSELAAKHRNLFVDDDESWDEQVDEIAVKLSKRIESVIPFMRKNLQAFVAPSLVDRHEAIEYFRKIKITISKSNTAEDVVAKRFMLALFGEDGDRVEENYQLELNKLSSVEDRAKLFGVRLIVFELIDVLNFPRMTGLAIKESDTFSDISKILDQYEKLFNQQYDIYSKKLDNEYKNIVQNETTKLRERKEICALRIQQLEKQKNEFIADIEIKKQQNIDAVLPNEFLKSLNNAVINEISEHWESQKTPILQQYNSEIDRIKKIQSDQLQKQVVIEAMFQTERQSRLDMIKQKMLDGLAKKKEQLCSGSLLFANVGETLDVNSEEESEASNSKVNFLDSNLVEKDRLRYSTIEIPKPTDKSQVIIIGGCGVRVPNQISQPILQGHALAENLIVAMSDVEPATLRRTNFEGAPLHAFKLGVRHKPLTDLSEAVEVFSSKTVKKDEMGSSETQAFQAMLTKSSAGLFNPRARDKAGQALVHYAAALDLPDLLPLASANNSNVLEMTDQHGFAPIHVAARAGNSTGVMHIVQAVPSSVNAKTIQAETPLMLASQNGHTETVQALLKLGVDINQRMPNGLYALYLAMLSHHVETAHVLIRCEGTEIDFTMDNGNSALHLAIELEQQTVALELIKRGANVTLKRKGDGFTALHLAAEKGFTEICSAILATGQIVVDAALPTGKTALHLAASFGKNETIKILISKHHADVDKKTEDGETPLMSAIYSCEEETAQYLSTLGHDTVDNKGQTASALALMLNQPAVAATILAKSAALAIHQDQLGRDAIYYMLQNGSFHLYKKTVEESRHPSEFYQRSYQGESSLALAAQYGHKLLMDYLCDKKARFETKKQFGFIHYVVKADHISVLKKLPLAERNYVDPNGRTLLYLAAGYGSENCLRELLKTAKQDKLFWTPRNRHLMLAAIASGKQRIVEMVLPHLSDINAVIDRENGDKVVHVAARLGLIDLLYFLEKNGAKLDAKNAAGQTIVDIARLNKDKKLGDIFSEKLLIKATISESMASDFHPLHIAAKSGVVAIVNKILTTGVDIDITGPQRITPLMCAACEGDIATLQLLLENGADPNKRDTDQNTALHYALDNKQLAAAALLIGVTCDVNARNRTGHTPFMIAAKHGMLPILKMLIDRGNILNHITPEGFDALHLAAEDNQIDVMRYLVSQGFDPNSAHKVDEKSLLRTPLQLAARQGNIDGFVALLALGADPAKEDSQHFTAIDHAIMGNHKYMLHFVAQLNLYYDPVRQAKMLSAAAQSDNTTIVDDLFLNDVPLNTPIEAGCTAIHFASIKDAVHVTASLIQSGADCNKPNDAGDTPVHYAALYGSLNVLQELIEANADINKQNNKGKTPLHIASEQGNYGIVLLLLKAKAKMDIVDKDYLTAGHYALKHRHWNIYNLFKLCGDLSLCETTISLLPKNIKENMDYYSSLSLSQEIHREEDAQYTYPKTPISLIEDAMGEHNLDAFKILCIWYSGIIDSPVGIFHLLYRAIDENRLSAVMILLEYQSLPDRSVASKLVERAMFVTKNPEMISLLKKLEAKIQNDDARYLKTQKNSSDTNRLAREHYKAGFDFYNRKMFTEALAQFNKSIALQENFAFSWYLRAYTYVRIHNFAEAIINFNRAVILDGNSLAPCYVDKENVNTINYTDPELVEAFKIFVKLHPSYLIAQWQLANLLAKTNSKVADMSMSSEALGIYDAAIALQPTNHLAHHAKAIGYYNIGAIDDAIIAFNNMLDLHPTFAPGFVLRGCAYLKSAKYDLAATLADFDAAIALCPTDSYLYCYLGLNYFKISGYEKKAMEMLQKALVIDPNNDLAKFNLARIQASHLNNQSTELRHTNGWEKAILLLDQAIELNNSCAEYYYNRAYCKLMAHKHGSSHEDLQQAFALNPKVEANYYFLDALRLYIADKNEEALLQCNKGLALDSGHEGGKAMLIKLNNIFLVKNACDLVAAGKTEDAIALLNEKAVTSNKAFHFDGDHANGNYIQAFCNLLYLNGHKNPEKELRDAIALNMTDDAHYHLFYALLLHECKKDEEALAECEKALVLCPNSAMALYVRVLICYQIMNDNIGSVFKKNADGTTTLTFNSKLHLLPILNIMVDSKKIISNDPNNSAHYFTFSHFYSAQGQYARAIEWMDELLKLQPINEEAVALRAMLEEQLSKAKQASLEQIPPASSATSTSQATKQEVSSDQSLSALQTATKHSAASQTSSSVGAGGVSRGVNPNSLFSSPASPPNSNTASVESEILNFLNTVTPRYLRDMQDATPGVALWGGDIEMDALCRLKAAYVTIHGNGTISSVGDKSSTNKIHLLYNGAHYTVCDSSGQEIREISPDGNCLFASFLTALNMLRGDNASISQTEIQNIRVNVSDIMRNDYDAIMRGDRITPVGYKGSVRLNNENNTIRSRFNSIFLADTHAQLQEAISILPVSNLRNEAVKLRGKLIACRMQEQSGVCKRIGFVA